ncbi:hypothetical protein ACO22_01752 [Paracoccidioides brasiliensis]|uniref:C3H1-type domain-containing protein n=1 Tax=Paracoccidioides brasiliensis TaxID=121759 RepID=A0A1D2JKV5_PARBR|nr:hypothetical protein ACO22_01752 [Paracoccidioides brasiliensis]
MSSSGFSFPPPPPPPPQSGTPGFPAPTPYGQNQRGRGTGGYQRGRGRGSALRSGRGSHSGGSSHGATPHSMNFTTGGGSRYGAHPHPHALNNPSPHYNPQAPLHYPPPQGQPNYSAVAAYTHAPPSHLPSPHNAYHQPLPAPYPARRPATHPLGYNQPPPVPQHGPSPNHHPPSLIISPPMRWGFESANQNPFYPPPDPRTPNFSYPDMRDSKPPYSPRQSHECHGPRQPQEYNLFPSTNRFSRGDKFVNRGSKRPYSSAFGTSQALNSKTPAPLPAPSFGNPLPSKPPPSVDATKKHKKKKRKYNQLGLTPKTEEHESSEDEDDVDEEAKLSQTVATGELKFTYKGQTSSLQSPSDIAAWIDERKKRYPTRARIEERLKEAEKQKKASREAKDAKRARENALRQQKSAEREETRRLQKEARSKKEKDKMEKKALKEEQLSLNPADAAAKAKLKAEKLRRKLMKEEKRVARAEADAEKARLWAEASKAQQINGVLEVEPKTHTGPSSVMELAPIPEYPDTAAEKSEPIKAGNNNIGDHMDIEKSQQESSTITPGKENEDYPQATITDPAVTNFTSIATENGDMTEGSSATNTNTPLDAISDKTIPSNPEVSDNGPSLSSSSGDEYDSDDESSSSDSESYDEDSDSSSLEPEQATSRREHPDRVLPLTRQPKNLCRQFAKTGDCRRGNKCKFLHEVSDEAKVASKPPASIHEKTGRKTLFQTLVSREKEEEDRQVMQAIFLLGQRGILDEPVTEPSQKAKDAPTTA